MIVLIEFKVVVLVVQVQVQVQVDVVYSLVDEQILSAFIPELQGPKSTPVINSVETYQERIRVL